jgi:hypothetical protein
MYVCIHVCTYDVSEPGGPTNRKPITEAVTTVNTSLGTSSRKCSLRRSMDSRFRAETNRLSCVQCLPNVYSFMLRFCSMRIATEPVRRVAVSMGFLSFSIDMTLPNASFSPVFNGPVNFFVQEHHTPNSTCRVPCIAHPRGCRMRSAIQGCARCNAIHCSLTY